MLCTAGDECSSVVLINQAVIQSGHHSINQSMNCNTCKTSSHGTNGIVTQHIGSCTSIFQGDSPIEYIKACSTGSFDAGWLQVKGNIGHLPSLQCLGQRALQHVHHRLPQLTKATDDHRAHVSGPHSYAGRAVICNTSSSLSATGTGSCLTHAWSSACTEKIHPRLLSHDSMLLCAGVQWLKDQAQCC